MELCLGTGVGAYVSFPQHISSEFPYSERQQQAVLLLSPSLFSPPLPSLSLPSPVFFSLLFSFPPLSLPFPSLPSLLLSLLSSPPLHSPLLSSSPFSLLFETGSGVFQAVSCVAKDDLGHMIPLSPHPKCWGHRPTWLHPVNEVLEVEPRFCAHWVSTLPTEPHPQPSSVLF